MATRRGRIAAAATLFAVVVVGWGLVTTEAQAPPKVKQVPASGHVGINGNETFAAYCAVCHGADGRGQGPAAPALKMPVPDLTTLAKRPGGFNELEVEHVIMGSDRMPAAHGSLAMPIWGPIFSSTGDQATAKLRARNVVVYLKSLQAK